MKTIFFVYNTPQPFVKIDLDLLKEQWNVEERFEKTPRKLNPIAIARAVYKCDLVFGWFASWHTLLPVLFARLMGKPSLIVVGGYDTANLPEANYGSQRGGIRGWLARTVIDNASHLIVNSHYIYRETIENLNINPQKMTVIYHGLDPWRMGEDNRARLVLTVGGVWQENLLRKGLLPFVQSAKYVPDAQFVVAGKWYDSSIDVLRSEASPNVEFRGYIPDDDLERLYMQTSVYVQPSLHEGFGLSVAEAMSAGCIPVVTKIGALPEVVSDLGVYSTSNTPKDVADAIQKALEIDHDMRHKAREHIIKNFPLNARRQALFALISSLTTKSTKESG